MLMSRRTIMKIPLIRCLLVQPQPPGMGRSSCLAIAAIFTVQLAGATPLLAEGQKAIVTPLFPPLAHPAEVHGVALSADGRWAATGCTDRFLRIWDVSTGRLHGEPLAHDGGVY